MALTNAYTTLALLKTSLAITDSTKDTTLEAAISSASRAIDGFTGRFFYADGTVSVPVVRYFTPKSETLVFTDDFTSLTEVAIDNALARTWSTVWATSDYMVEPINNPRQGKPYDRIIAVGRYIFPTAYPQSVRMTGIWGFTTVPDVVAQACLIQASRIYNRALSPFGIAGSPDLGVVRLSARLDPDVQVLLAPYVRTDGMVY